MQWPGQSSANAAQGASHPHLPFSTPQVTLHLQIDELPFTKVATCFLDGSTDEILQGLDPHLPAPFA